MLCFPHLYRRFQLTAVVLVFAGNAGAQVGLGLSPMREEFKIAAGRQRSGALALNNDTPMKVRITAGLLDFYIDAGGTPQFSRQLASEAEDSCRQWLTINPMELELEGNAQAQTRRTRSSLGRGTGAWQKVGDRPFP